MRLSLLFLFMCFIGFSQNKQDNNNNQPLFVSTIGINTSNFPQKNLDAVTASIQTISLSQKHYNSTNFVALTSTSNKVYKFSDFSSKIDLNKTLDNIMFTGNFFNPKETHYSSLYNENN